MGTATEHLATALEQHQAGNLKEAEKAYRQVLKDQPGNVDALQHLGVLAFQVGKHSTAAEYLNLALKAANAKSASILARLGATYGAMRQADDAVDHLQRSLELWPDNAEAHFNLANAYSVQERHEEAVTHLRRAAELNPADLRSLRNLPIALKRLDRPEEAVQACREVLKHAPDDLRTARRLCELLQELGELDEAENQLNETLQQQPDSPELLCQLGCLHQTRGKHEEAAAAFRKAVEIKPDLAEAHFNLGNALRDGGRRDLSVDCFQQAVLLKPEFYQAYNNLGVDLRALGRVEESVQCLSRCVRVRPEYAPGLANLGSAHQELGHTEKAVECYQRALEVDPDYAEAHCNLAMMLLRRGDFEHGWNEYEWRWKCAGHQAREFPQPLWDGSPLAGRSIYLHTEQGMGDAIQFVRYATLIKERGGQVLLGCPSRLAPLLGSCEDVDEVFPIDGPLPKFDVHAPLLSLPRILETRLETIPAETPYLSVEQECQLRWPKRLKPVRGFRIGIFWQGNSQHLADKLRSIPLAQFAPLAEMSDVQLIALQQGPGLEQLSRINFPIVRLNGPMDCAGAFLDTASLMNHLDLIITCDTAGAHVAGAFGLPVWVALPLAADWRWLENREDTPWYPTMRLFRQPSFNNWSAVFEEMREELEPLTAKKQLNLPRPKRSQSAIEDKNVVIDIVSEEPGE